MAKPWLPATRRASKRVWRCCSEVATAETGLSIAELAQATGLNRTTTYRLCEALEGPGWLQFAADGPSARRRRVGLVPRALGLAVLVNNKYDPETRLEPLMEKLARTVGETVHAGMLDETWIIHVARSVPEAGLHMAAPLGSRELAHVTALGKAMLATLSRARSCCVATATRSCWFERAGRSRPGRRSSRSSGVSRPEGTRSTTRNRGRAFAVSVRRFSARQARRPSRSA